MSIQSNESWCSKIERDLNSSESRIAALNDIQNKFRTVTRDERKELANVLEFSPVFDCVKDDSVQETFELACEVLTECLSNMDIGFSVTRYTNELEDALNHSDPNVKVIVLREIFRVASSIEHASLIYNNEALLIALIKTLREDEVAVAQYGIKILSVVGQTTEGLKHIMTPGLKDEISNTMAYNTLAQYRMFDVITEVALYSDESLQCLVPSGVLDFLLSELDNNDPLLKLNIIEYLTKLAVTQHGLNYLENKGIVAKIMETVARLYYEQEEDPYATILFPGYLKFYGNVAHWKPHEMFSEYPAGVDVMFNILSDFDLALLGVAYDTLGHIAVTNAGKFEIENTGNKFYDALKRIGQSLGNVTQDLRVRALNCIEQLVRVQVGTQNNRVCALTRKWFTYFSDKPMDQVLQYAQQTFAEMRTSALNIFQAIAEQEWGQEMIRDTPGLVEFFLDRSGEISKESKEIKYEIVCALAQSSIFTEDMLVNLQKYVKEGPFYVAPVPHQVAYGGTS